MIFFQYIQIKIRNVVFLHLTLLLDKIILKIILDFQHRFQILVEKNIKKNI